jgi:glutamyl-tRNA synthetase
MISDNVRVRFAPSPTGYLHVGGLRTALYNYLFAKANNGTFVLRIEDTDQNRYVEGAVENLINTLNWVGLSYDEGPEKEGEYGPYYQSQRLDIYKKYALELVEKGKAYYAFDTPERLQELREKQIAEKLQPKYDKADLDLSPEEFKQKLDNGEPYVIRLNVVPGLRVTVNDKIRGLVEFSTDIVDDQILIKSDGFPTYHLANVVDDHLMKITHVIRGEEWLPSTPKHVLLYDYLGWEKPEFAHLPLLLNPDKSKLSKRQGDVAVEDYKAKGYLKEALINFVALLGWNAGDEKEFYQLEELISSFSLERVHKAGAVFNLEKLDWLNFEHLRNKPENEVLEMLKSELKASVYSDKKFTDEYLLKVIEAMRERVNFAKDFINNSPYFFEEPTSYDETVVSKRWKEDSPVLLKKLNDEFAALDNPTKEDYETALKKVAESESAGVGKLIHPLRLAVSGVGGGPGVYDILVIIGKEKTISRINKAIAEIKP